MLARARGRIDMPAIRREKVSATSSCVSHKYSTVLFEARVEWARTNTPVTAKTVSDLRDLSGVRLACNLQLDIKMIPALEGLVKKGAQLHVTCSSPQTTSNEVVEYLSARSGVTAIADSNMNSEAWKASLDAALEWEPTHLCEMGAALSARYLTDDSKRCPIAAALEATGTGIRRLRSLAANHSLMYPVFNWDDCPIKNQLHIGHVTALVACSSFLLRTRLTFHTKRVLVIGYGLAGRSVADAARAFGGIVKVFDSAADRRLEAMFAGEDTCYSLEEGLSTCDIIITVTSSASVIDAQNWECIKPGAFLINAGSHDNEIDVDALYKRFPHQTLFPDVTRVNMHGNHVFVFANGSVRNLMHGPGDLLNSNDSTLATMLAGVAWMVENANKYSPGIHALPKAAWKRVAETTVKLSQQQVPS